MGKKIDVIGKATIGHGLQGSVSCSRNAWGGQMKFSVSPKVRVRNVGIHRAPQCKQDVASGKADLELCHGHASPSVNTAPRRPLPALQHCIKTWLAMSGVERWNLALQLKYVKGLVVWTCNVVCLSLSGPSEPSGCRLQQRAVFAAANSGN
jgi:hypothetical protein